MKTVREAQDAILERVGQLSGEVGIEEVAIGESLGRVLAEDISSNRNHPPYDISAMDGYALLYDDIKNATKDEPVLLDVIDDIRAGTMPNAVVSTGKVSRIMTGAPTPEGCDTVIRVEDTSGTDNGEKVKILLPPKKGSNIRSMGENLRAGEQVLSAGTTIGTGEVGILAMVKRAMVPVYKRPRVAILSTGDELEAIDEPFDINKIPDANSYSIMAEMQAIGVEPTLLGIARDTQEELLEKLREGMDYDVLIVSGGVAVGHHDFVRPSLKEIGVEMHFWRVALRPGHPFAFGTASDDRSGEGRSGGTIVFGLPGNPVSSMVCTSQFIVPAIRKMEGHAALFRATYKARLTAPVKDRMGRLHFMRVTVGKGADGAVEVTSTGPQGSGILMSMVEADGLMVVPAEADALEAGAEVTVQSLDPYGFQPETGF